jgi:hypothetical protein
MCYKSSAKKRSSYTMIEGIISKLVKDNLVIEITDNGIFLSTNEISSIKLNSIDDINEEFILKLSKKINNK